MCRLFSTYLGGFHAGPGFGFGLERSVVDHRGRCAIRQAEVGAAKTMIERTEERFGLKPERLVGDTAYGAAPMLKWLVEEKGIAPHAAFSQLRLAFRVLSFYVGPFVQNRAQH